jgi:hypothetical protein
LKTWSLVSSGILARETPFGALRPPFVDGESIKGANGLRFAFYGQAKRHTRAQKNPKPRPTARHTLNPIDLLKQTIRKNSLDLET